MRTPWVLGRWALRRHWRTSLAVGLLIGLGAGAAAGAAMGARRTATAFPRLVDELRPSDVVLTSQFDDPIDATHEDAIGALPEVADLRRVWGFGMIERTADGLPDFEGSGWQATGGPDGEYPYRSDRPKLVSGRLPPPGDPAAAAINRVAADFDDLEVGDTIRAMTFDVVEVSRIEEPETDAERLALVRRLFRPVDLRITGIYAEIEEIGGQSQSADDPALVLSRAFVDAHRDINPYRVLGVVLAEGTSQEELTAAVRRVIAPRQLDLQTSRREVTDSVDRSVAPVVGALWIFAGLMLIATFLVAGQGLARSIRTEVTETAPLNALGMTRTDRAVAAMPRAAAIALGAAAVAVVVAAGSSWWFPLAPVEEADPDPGLRLDPLVLAIAFVGIVLATLLWGWVTAWRATRSSAPPAVIRTDSLDAVSRSGLPAPVSTGLRMALGRRGPDSAVPIGLVALATTTAIATVVGAIGFGSSLERLVDTPRLYGWTWDAMVFDPPEAGGEVAGRIETDPAVGAVTAVRGQTVLVEGRSVLAAGFEPLRGSIFPTVTVGRAPSGSDEAALGRRTMRRLGVSVGDTVEIVGTNGGPRRFEVVGEVVFPVTNPDVSSQADLGVGVALDQPGFEAVAGEGRASSYFVDAAPGAGGMGALRDSFGTQLFGPQQPPDIRNYERVHPVPLVLAGLVGALGCGMLTLGLTGAIRRRRRDLAVLRTLGFDRRQVRWTLASQAMSVVVPAILIGIPVGVALGRQAWTVLADRLSVPAAPATSIALLAAVTAGTILLANATAALAAVRVGRSRPADVLRAE